MGGGKPSKGNSSPNDKSGFRASRRSIAAAATGLGVRRDRSKHDSDLPLPEHLL